MINTNGQFNKAAMLYSKKQYDEAIEIFEDLYFSYGTGLGQDSYFDVLTYLGRCNAASIHGSARKAVEYFSGAAVMGYAPAQYYLGKFYEEQYHKKNNSLFSGNLNEGARFWYNISAKSGYAPSEYRLGHCYALDNNYGEALKWYSLSAEKNYSPALWTLGWFYENGDKFGSEKNCNKAVDFYIKSANNGYARAQADLIRCYKEGIGVKKDEQKSDYWRQKAFTQNRHGINFKFSEMEEGDIIKDLEIEDENNDETTILNVCKCDRYIQCGFAANGKYYSDDFGCCKSSVTHRKCFMGSGPAPDPGIIKIKAEITGYHDWYYL